MNENDISSSIELDAALTGRALRKREKLWKMADGHSFRPGDIVVVLLGAVVAIFGLGTTLFEQDSFGVFDIALGLGLLGSVYLRHQQRQLSALRELVRDINSRLPAAPPRDYAMPPRKDADPSRL